MELPEQHKFLTTFLTSNKILRNQLIGIVIGMMTESELQFYLTDQKACNKRIIQMQVTRFIAQLNQA